MSPTQPDTPGQPRHEREPHCERHHLPKLHLPNMADHVRKAKSLITDKPATLSAPGLAGWVASGHTHGQTTWAVVILTGLMLASETTVKIANIRKR